MDKKLVIDSAFRSLNFNGERICGDSFLIRTSPSGRRTIAVLSDGMGHGIKANILSTFPATMLLNFITSHDDIDSIADIILRMLPVNPKYDVSYSTFTLADIDNHTGEISIVQYDNPPVILLRGGIPSELNWEEKQSVRENGKPLCMRTARFMAKENDRLVMVRDGVTLSGKRNESYKFGWSHFERQQFNSYIASVNNGISWADLADQEV